MERPAASVPPHGSNIPPAPFKGGERGSASVLASTVQLYETLAELLRYPDERFGALLEQTLKIAAAYPEVATHLLAFKDEMGERPLHELEEHYIKTFDLNPLCTLDLGWQLFGEDYNRGLFLAKLRRLMREHGLVESQELPDHLTHVLLLLARMDAEPAAEFVGVCVAPALEKLLGTLKQGEPYRLLLLAILTLLQEVHTPALEEATHG